MPQTEALSPAAAEVLTAARALPAEERVAVADRLLEETTSDEDRSPPVPRSLLDELEHDFTEIEAGRLEARTWEDVRAEVEQIIRRGEDSDRGVSDAGR